MQTIPRFFPHRLLHGTTISSIINWPVVPLHFLIQYFCSIDKILSSTNSYTPSAISAAYSFHINGRQEISLELSTVFSFDASFKRNTIQPLVSHARISSTQSVNVLDHSAINLWHLLNFLFLFSFVITNPPVSPGPTTFQLLIVFANISDIVLGKEDNFLPGIKYCLLQPAELFSSSIILVLHAPYLTGPKLLTCQIVMNFLIKSILVGSKPSVFPVLFNTLLKPNSFCFLSKHALLQHLSHNIQSFCFSNFLNRFQIYDHSSTFLFFSYQLLTLRCSES